jgi:hypothetical protein
VDWHLPGGAARFRRRHRGADAVELLFDAEHVSVDVSPFESARL